MSNNENDFKLLAIRPLNGCHRDFCNNLEYDQLFQFYKSYSFTCNNEGIVTDITKIENDFDLHSDYISNKEKLRINVSAIVGKNGSGKSTLADLFYMCCYLVAVSNNLIESDPKSTVGIKQSEDLKKIISGLKVEVFFQIGQSYSCFYIDSGKSARENIPTNINYFDLNNDLPIPLSKFFYTIAINYSIYSLNEAILGPWIGKLFHKNDGYRTPVVLNPFREIGNINVNAEMHFAQTRLLSNLQYDKTDGGKVLPGGEIKEIAFDFEKAKRKRYDGHSTKRIFEELEIGIGKTCQEIFVQIYIAFLKEDPLSIDMQITEWAEMTKEYVVTKIIRIAKHYPEYKKYYTTVSEEEVPSIRDLEEYIDELQKDLSHVTLKLRQALFFYKNDPLRPDDDRIKVTQRRVTIPADLFAKRREESVLIHPNRDPMEFTPIAPFTPRVVLKGGRLFSRLSSGEQQYIHTIQAIIYHILNVNSVFNTNIAHSKSTYRFINLILDEIELYFHPEFQRRFLNDLLKIISGLNIPNISGINILFLTHSPFILSDIHASNVTMLLDGKPIESDVLTFAGNIHQMLTESFFMSSTTGDFAKVQYEAIINFYQEVQKSIDKDYDKLSERYDKLRNKFYYIVSQIAEDLIRGILENHLEYLDKKFVKPNRKDLEAQLALITKKLEELE